MPAKIKEDQNGDHGLDYDDLLLTALGITVALSWNAAAKESIDAIYPVKSVSSARAHILYAVVITIIAIMVLYLFSLVKIVANGAASHFETFKQPAPPKMQSDAYEHRCRCMDNCRCKEGANVDMNTYTHKYPDIYTQNDVMYWQPQSTGDRF